MNKMKDRQKAKAFLVAQAHIDIALQTVELKKGQFFAGCCAPLIKLISLNAQLENIKRVPYKALKTNGKIDKRRYRRFVTRHRKSIKALVPNSAHAHINEKRLYGILE